MRPKPPQSTTPHHFSHARSEHLNDRTRLHFASYPAETHHTSTSPSTSPQQDNVHSSIFSMAENEEMPILSILSPDFSTDEDVYRTCLYNDKRLAEILKRVWSRYRVQFW